jgi:hypothetical protein
LRERSAAQIALSARYDLDYKLLGTLELTNRNVLHPDSDLFLNVMLGGAERLEIGNVRHQLFNSSLSLTSLFRAQSIPKSAFDGETLLGAYKDRRYGLQTAAQYPFWNRAQLDVGYSWENISLRRGNPVGLPAPTTGNFAALDLGIALDTLDKREIPTKGTLGQLRYTWWSKGLGSDFSFSRFALNFQNYLTPIKHLTLRLSGDLTSNSGGAPYLEFQRTGGAYDLSFGSIPFPGLRRDEIVSRRAALVGAAVRPLLREFESGPLNGIYLNLNYRAGWFSHDRFDSWRFTNPLHGFGTGLWFDMDFLGPILFQLSRTDRTGLRTDFSIGRTF